MRNAVQEGLKHGKYRHVGSSLRGIGRQVIQQTLPEDEWNIDLPLCKTLVIFLLVVVLI